MYASVKLYASIVADFLHAMFLFSIVLAGRVCLGEAREWLCRSVCDHLTAMFAKNIWLSIFWGITCNKF